jgi:hypothetical protein
MQGIRTVERRFLAGSRRVAVGGNGGLLISDSVTRAATNDFSAAVRRSSMPPSEAWKPFAEICR